MKLPPPLPSAQTHKSKQARETRDDLKKNILIKRFHFLRIWPMKFGSWPLKLNGIWRSKFDIIQFSIFPVLKFGLKINWYSLEMRNSQGPMFYSKPTKSLDFFRILNTMESCIRPSCMPRAHYWKLMASMARGRNFVTTGKAMITASFFFKFWTLLKSTGDPERK